MPRREAGPPSPLAKIAKNAKILRKNMDLPSFFIFEIFVLFAAI